MTERRYDENEVSEIFARAADAGPAGQRALPAGEGMTLAELQEIGREAGMTPQQVAQAARALDRPAQRTPSRFLGLPIGVGRMVQLDRRLSDAEWERLVVTLRDTFQASGTIRVDGSLRQWSNGNLHVLVEPGLGGDRVRLQTRNSTAPGLLMAGASMIAATGLGFAITLMGGGPAGEVLGALSPIGAVGIGFVAVSVARLRSWARLRQQQMDAIAERLESGERS